MQQLSVMGVLPHMHIGENKQTTVDLDVEYLLIQCICREKHACFIELERNSIDIIRVLQCFSGHETPASVLYRDKNCH